MSTPLNCLFFVVAETRVFNKKSVRNSAKTLFFTTVKKAELWVKKRVEFACLLLQLQALRPCNNFKQLSRSQRVHVFFLLYFTTNYIIGDLDAHMCIKSVFAFDLPCVLSSTTHTHVYACTHIHTHIHKVRLTLC